MATTAMIAIPAPQSNAHIDPSLSASSNMDPASALVSIPRRVNGDLSESGNRYLPYCPPGSLPDSGIGGLSDSEDDDLDLPNRSLLYPPDVYEMVMVKNHTMYIIDPAGVAAAVKHISEQPLPPANKVFPWLHGAHPNNSEQQSVFGLAPLRPPACMRSVTIVKASRDLTRQKLKGAVVPGDFLDMTRRGGQHTFLDIEPRNGFSVRNFHTQLVKIATVSDIIVYGDEDSRDHTFMVAHAVATAQTAWRSTWSQVAVPGELPLPKYNVFVCISNFLEFEVSFPEMVAIDSNGYLTGNELDLQAQEKAEMLDMGRPTEIAHNVFLGLTPPATTEPEYDVFIDCCIDSAYIEPKEYWRALSEPKVLPDGRLQVENLAFASSGAMTSLTNKEVAKVVEVCKLIHHMANGTLPTDVELRGFSFSEREPEPVETQDVICSSGFSDSESDEDDNEDDNEDEHEEVHHIEHVESAEDDNITEIEEDIPMNDVPATPLRPTTQPRRILLHCNDGYSETTLLAVAYYAFSTGRTISSAWLSLHVDLHRDIFAYPSDVSVLQRLSFPLLKESPMHRHTCAENLQILVNEAPGWFRHRFDGSFPSRVLDDLYLGNLDQASNPDMLKSLGITQILSVGEIPRWPDGTLDRWGPDNLMKLVNIQDNGMDSLMSYLPSAFEFIERGRQSGGKTLVHCRVGVSRSATVVIAEVMRRGLATDVGKAYCFVRARRLNVIIQPHLKFLFELMRWEHERSGHRDLEWMDMATQIAKLNAPFHPRRR